MVAYTIHTAEEITQEKEVVTISIGDVWFGSVRAAIAAAKRNTEAMY